MPTKTFELVPARASRPPSDVIFGSDEESDTNKSNDETIHPEKLRGKKIYDKEDDRKMAAKETMHPKKLRGKKSLIKKIIERWLQKLLHD